VVLSKILTYLRFKPSEPEISVESLLDDIETLLVKNQIGYLEIEREMDRVKIFEANRTDRLKDGIENGHLKRIVLREIQSLRKRVISLDRVGRVYQQNIDIHLMMQDKLENQLATGMKQITQAQLEEITLDHVEMLREHHEVIASAAVLINSQSYLDEIREDPDLKNLSRELEAEFAKEKD
jgi:hypothetical protein